MTSTFVVRSGTSALLLLAIGCGSAANGGGTAGSHSGGANAGGASTQGGTSNGGSNTGGVNPGGSSSGGSNTAGANTGGSDSGGASNGGSNVGGSSDGGAAGSGDGGAGTSDLCPSAPPAEGSPCTSPMGEDFLIRAHCSWGDDPRPDCRTTALCSQDQWQVTMPTAPYCADDPLPAACPTQSPAAGSTCADETLQCWYEDGSRCWCSGCMGGSEYPICQTITPPEWACGSPDPDCPNPLPQAGEPCDTPALSCGPNCEQPIVCREGSWHYDQGMCPICASPDTAIATPGGEVPIAELEEGDLVYSVEGEAIVTVPVLRTASTPVVGHRVLRVTLDDGRTLELSPRHPLADGRPLSDLARGSAFDERHTVVSTELIPYEHDRTYDILPASSSGTYFASGALVGSSLAPKHSAPTQVDGVQGRN